MEGSPKFTINKDQIIKTLHVAAIAGFAAFMTSISQLIAQTDFGVWTPAVAGFWAGVAAFLHQYIPDNTTASSGE